MVVKGSLEKSEIEKWITREKIEKKEGSSDKVAVETKMLVKRENERGSKSVSQKIQNVKLRNLTGQVLSQQVEVKKPLK